MLSNIGLYSYLIACITFAALGGLLVMRWRVNPLGPALFIACTAMSIWAATIVLSTSLVQPPVTAIQISELARIACWLFILLQLLSIRNNNTPWTIKGRHWRLVFFTVLAASLALIVLGPVFQATFSDAPASSQLVLVLWLALALLGLLLIEQLFRNATQTERWAIKYLCFGLGIMFAYDFFMYSDALLFRQLDENLWQARGFVNAIATPLLAIAIARNNNWQVNLQVSRQMVFHTVTLIGAGLYLMVMALTGYFINWIGGTWGGVLQMSFLVVAGALLLSLLFSGKLRAQTRVFLSKHFFSYHYDYRQEWLKFTQALGSLNQNVAEGIIQIMAPLANSPAGLLWGSVDGQPMRLLAHWQISPPTGAEEGLGELPNWLHRTEWVIDLLEWRRTPDVYGQLVLPDWMQRDDQLWLVIPLVFRDQVEGVLMLKKSDIKHNINWEDRDLLKTAGRQAATHLAQHMASNALVEARQFDAFNRLSAYVVHDLKNILAQQSLIISNAARHRNNPAFVDDMISTVENSVARMQRLMEQMRSGIRSTPAATVQVGSLLNNVINGRKNFMPLPQPEFTAEDCTVEADRERLATVFNHLIQNAQEATAPQGTVIVRLAREKDWVKVTIEDSGRGMDEDFIREKLFRPFESTKGLTGMGIGAFESREYIRQLGGDISVDSSPERGSVFSITIPASEQKGSASKNADVQFIAQ